MKIIIINGPNLNLLGKREPQVYGAESFEAYLERLKVKFPTVSFEYFQSNIEGEIIDLLHRFGFSEKGIILNPGGYAHTSVAIADAIKAIDAAVVEVHISNIFARESFRHVSLTAQACSGSISGFGLKSYDLAVQSFL